MGQHSAFEDLNPAIVANVEFVDDQFNTKVFEPNLWFAPDLGFMAIREGRGIRVVGFHADVTGRAHLTAATKLNQQPPQRRSVEANPHGVGVILGNTQDAIRKPNTNMANRVVGLYMTPVLDWGEIAKLHSENPFKVTPVRERTVRQAGLLAIDRLLGPKAIIKRIERPYRDASLATFDPPAELLQEQEPDQYVENPVLAIYRDPKRPLERIGVVRTPPTSTD
jgi:hypothetical protein